MAYWKGAAATQPMSTPDTWYTWEITGIPQNCTLAEVVLLFTDISGATKATVFISHDDDGLVGVVPFVTSSATQAINDRDSSGDGFVAIGLGGVWFSDAGENPRLHCKIDGTCSGAVPRLYAVRTRES